MQKPGLPRRIHYLERVGLDRGPITAYWDLNEFRSGDSWTESRDRLQKAVQSQLLKEAAFTAPGTVSLYDVWASIVPQVRPSHWVTAGFRSSKVRIPIIHFPASFTGDVIRDIGGPCFFAIDALPYPKSLETISKRDRAVFCLTLLYALSIAVRDQIRNGRKELLRFRVLN